MELLSIIFKFVSHYGTVWVVFLTCFTLNIFRYYPALKTLEQLEHTYLPRIKK